MTSVMIDPELATKLRSNGGKVLLADQTGDAVGFFVSSERLALFEKALDAYLYDEPTAEDIRRALADPRRHTMEEVMKLVEGD